MLIKCGSCVKAAYTIWKSYVGVSCTLVGCVCAFVGMNNKQYKMHGVYIKILLLQKKNPVIQLFEPCTAYCRCLKRDTVQPGSNLPKFQRNLYRVPPKRPQFSTTLLGFT
jgi:hypothetical protein